MKTLAVWLLSLAGTCVWAQSPATAPRKFYADPYMQAAADEAAAQERAHQERTSGMLQRPLLTSVELTSGTRYKVTVLGVKPEGLIIDASEGIRQRSQLLRKDALGLEDKVRFGYGTPDEVAAVAKIQATREKARIAAEKLELQRQQTEATQAIADELYRQEQNRLIFGR